MKICFKCHRELPLSDFYRHPETADGYLRKCKECNKKDVRENYRLRRARYVAYERVRTAIVTTDPLTHEIDIQKPLHLTDLHTV